MVGLTLLHTGNSRGIGSTELYTPIYKSTYYNVLYHCPPILPSILSIKFIFPAPNPSPKKKGG